MSGFCYQPYWVGAGYPQDKHKILVLGESDYQCEALDPYVKRWIKEGRDDATFTKVVNALGTSDESDAKASDAARSLAARGEFWDKIAFYNFAGLLESNESDRPYAEAKQKLPPVLAEIAPRGVWIWGKGQAKYSEAVVKAHRLVYVISTHPSHAAHESTRSDWKKLLSMVAHLRRT